ncbi:MAG: response regulator [Bacteroidetes bacterium]|nr:MAG: response regulator [Bacteroidota bacterium]
MRGNILVIDDERHVYEDIHEALPAHNVYYAESLPRVKDTFTRKDIDLAIVDLNIKVNEKDRFSGLDYIKTIRKRYPTVKIVAHSSYREIERIQTAILNGAEEYLYKGKLDLFSEEFREKINQLINSKKKQDFRRSELKKELIGCSPQQMRLREQLDSLAARRDSFFLIGEPGLDKENVIHYLHYKSQHYVSSKPPVIEDCSLWLREELLKVMSRKPGSKKRDFLKQAHGSILFVRNTELLDKGIQNGFAEMIGKQRYLHSREPLPVQFVFELETEASKLLKVGKLQDAFFHELEHVYLAPLRERPADIELYVEKWMQVNDFPIGLITPKVWDILLQYPWPGNVEELYKVLNDMMETHKQAHPQKNPITGRYQYMSKEVALTSLPADLFQKQERLEDMAEAVARLELEYIEKALQLHHGKKDKAAKALGIQSSDHLKKTYINKYDKLYPALIRQFPLIVKYYKLK